MRRSNIVYLRASKNLNNLKNTLKTLMLLKILIPCVKRVVFDTLLVSCIMVVFDTFFILEYPKN
jgi:hypothetical protein